MVAHINQVNENYNKIRSAQQAVIVELSTDASPEAKVAIAAFEAMQKDQEKVSESWQKLSDDLTRMSATPNKVLK